MDFGKIAGALNPTAVLGSALSVGSDLAGMYEQRRNEAFQREFAQNGIRWRMADAAAAGLSPVYGAGLSGAVGSPTSVDFGGLRGMGQDITRAALASATPEEKAAASLNMKLVESQIDETDARKEGIRLQNAKLMQELYGTPGMPSLFSGGSGGMERGKGLVVHEAEQFGPGLRGAVSPEAVKVPSVSGSSRAVVAGESPAWQDFRLSDGTVVSLPYAGEGQTFMGQNPTWGMVLSAPQWLFHQLENLGSKVAARGARDRARGYGFRVPSVRDQYNPR